MFLLPLDATDDQMRDAAHQWVDLFAADRYEEAFAFLANAQSGDWSADRIKTIVRRFKPDHPCYGDAPPRITACKTASIIREFDDPLLDGPCHLVLHFLPGGKYPGHAAVLEFQLPINGYWSWALVVFLIKEVQNGLALELHDVVVEDQ